MAVIIDTAKMPEIMSLDARLWVYCGIDSCMTAEVDEVIDPLLTETTRATYEFDMDQRGPAFSMMTRGILINPEKRRQLRGKLILQREKFEKWLTKLAVAVWDDGLNPRSHVQLKQFFYERMELPKVYINIKGKKVLSMNRESLEKLHIHLQARPFCSLILAIRDLGKKIETVESGVDPDGRLRSSFNVAATETGRWASSKNAWGRGLNMMNQTEEMREIFIADEGKILVNADLEQAESRGVAYMSEDEAYIDACESGDLHTSVAMMIWSDLAWSDDPIHNRKLADEPFYRWFSRRYMAKRSGHASNYLITAWMLARQLKVEQSFCEEFQDDYFTAFSGVKRWHHEIQRELQSTGVLTTPFFNRRRAFFGRLDDAATLREAVAYKPQGLICDILERGLFTAWKHLQIEEGKIEVLAQGYDSMLYQVEEGDDETIGRVQDYLLQDIPILGRTMTIPVETKVGYDWKNMEKWKSPAAAALQRPNISTNPLDWKFA